LGVQPDDAVGVAERILAALRAPFRLGPHEVFVTASIGIAPGGGGDGLRPAAGRAARRGHGDVPGEGKSRHQVFDAGMHARAVKLLEVENDLRRALDRGEFELYYQPIVVIGTGRLSGFEALVRWQHPERGLVRWRTR